MNWQGIAGITFAVACALGCSGGAQETAASAGSALSGSPYPKSSVITGISWDFAHMTELAIGSDLWPTTWGADGNVWAGWGDGGGFGGSNSVDRVSIGFGSIAGAPPGIVGTNVWGNTNAGAAKAEHQATFCGKPESMLAVGGVLYAWVGSFYNDSANDNPRCPANPSVSNHHLAWSSNDGASWQEATWSFTDNSGSFVFNSFLNFGQNYAGAKDSYVYLYGYRVGTDAGYLARVPETAVTTLASYEVFTGMSNGQPTWSPSYTTSQAAPVIGAGAGGGGVVFYHPATGRYIDASFYGGVGSLIILDAPEPWGPWTTVEYETNWGGYGTAESLALTFPTKWISSDGKTLWGVFSWGDPQLGDALHLMKATLTFGSAPALVTIDSVSTGKAYDTQPAQVGQTLFIDRTYTITSLSSSLAGGTLVQTANDDKHVTSSDLFSFTLARAATVHVVYDNRITGEPAWLSGWSVNASDALASTAYPSGVRIYSKAFAAGTFTLGGNWAPPATSQVSGTNYVVIAK